MLVKTKIKMYVKSMLMKIRTYYFKHIHQHTLLTLDQSSKDFSDFYQGVNRLP